VEDPTSEHDRNAADPETDHVVAQYLVRSASLPCSAFERNKRWRVGSHAGQRRVRWALYTAPMALPTLRGSGISRASGHLRARGRAGP